MKNLQKNTLKNILDGEQLSISALSEKTEINRSYLSQLLNHNKQLNERDWKLLTECYPEYSEQKIELTVNKVKPAKQSKPSSLIIIDDPLNPSRDPKKLENQKEIKAEKEVVQPIAKAPDAQKATKEEKVPSEETAQEKAIKTKEENRHRNLNCPESGYHMKVPYRDLLRARPLCPLSQLPMMLKEEIRQYKSLDDAGKKGFISSLKSSINLLTK